MEQGLVEDSIRFLFHHLQAFLLLVLKRGWIKINDLIQPKFLQHKGRNFDLIQDQNIVVFFQRIVRVVLNQNRYVNECLLIL
jgi:hypothetical protein